MHDRAVQAFRIILDDELPVCLEMIDAPLHHLKLFHAPWLKLLIESGQMLLKGNGSRREVDEDMSVPNCRGHRVERVVSFTEALYFFHVRGVRQSAIELVGPGVILALNAAGKFALLI